VAHELNEAKQIITGSSGAGEIATRRQRRFVEALTGRELAAAFPGSPFPARHPPHDWSGGVCMENDRSRFTIQRAVCRHLLSDIGQNQS
jgi:hypothetical protein